MERASIPQSPRPELPRRGTLRPRCRAADRARLLDRVWYLSVGSNVDPGLHIPSALDLLDLDGGLEAVSGVYLTQPWGDSDQPPFHNLAVRLRGSLSCLQLLTLCQGIEARLGRIRRRTWGPREIDLDLLMCQPSLRLAHPRLQLPHPRIEQRAFVLAPLLELADTLPASRRLGLQAASQRVLDQSLQRLGSTAQVYGTSFPRNAVSCEPLHRPGDES